MNLAESANRYIKEDNQEIDLIYTGQKSRSGKLDKPRFDLNNIGQREAVDQEGPGFYFTTNKDEANGYAYPNGIIVTAKYNGNNLISTDSKLNKKHIDKMISMAPDDKYGS